MEKNLLPWSRKSTTHCFAASPPHSVRFHDWASAASSKIATGCWPAAHAHSGHWPYSCSQQFSQLLGLKSCWGMHILPPPPNRETAGTAAWISTWVEDHWSAEKQPESKSSKKCGVRHLRLMLSEGPQAPATSATWLVPTAFILQLIVWLQSMRYLQASKLTNYPQPLCFRLLSMGTSLSWLMTVLKHPEAK